MSRYLSATVTTACLLTLVWSCPSSAANGSRMRVSLRGITVSGQAISRADAATLTNRLRAELARSSRFAVVEGTDADFTVGAMVSRQDTTYLVKMDIQSLKTERSTAVEARYSIFTDLISGFTRNLPGLVSIRLEQSIRGLTPALQTRSKTHNAVYMVVGAIVAGGTTTALLLVRGGKDKGIVVPPRPAPGSISLTINVP